MLFARDAGAGAEQLVLYVDCCAELATLPRTTAFVDRRRPVDRCMSYEEEDTCHMRRRTCLLI
jgi:hypothetical protein